MRRKTMQEAHAEAHEALCELGRAMLSGAHMFLFGVWVGMLVMAVVVWLS